MEKHADQTDENHTTRRLKETTKTKTKTETTGSTTNKRRRIKERSRFGGTAIHLGKDVARKETEMDED